MTEAVEKTKKPAPSNFKQQRLSAWQPILTAGTVLPTFFVIGILFIPVGIGLLVFSDNVKEYVVDYTNCKDLKGEPCENIIKPTPGMTAPKTCQCAPIDVTIEDDLGGRVYIYYALTNFYQNHRRYVKSRDDKQLLGLVGTPENPVEPDASCDPYRRVRGDPVQSAEGKIFFPCGAIANSMFTDKIDLLKNGEPVPLSSKNIAWDSDKQYKFKNPSWWKNATAPGVEDTHDAWKKFTKPQDWTPTFWEEWKKDGVENEDFIVWMRTAALPNFRKLYRILDQSAAIPGYKNGLPKGNYTLNITYSFRVASFQGTKSVVISTTSLLGGKNPFLGISYIVVGAICLVLGIVFLFIHINYGKSTYEMTTVDPRTPY